MRKHTAFVWGTCRARVEQMAAKTACGNNVCQQVHMPLSGKQHLIKQLSPMRPARRTLQCYLIVGSENLLLALLRVHQNVALPGISQSPVLALYALSKDSASPGTATLFNKPTQPRENLTQSYCCQSFLMWPQWLQTNLLTVSTGSKHSKCRSQLHLQWVGCAA